MTGVRIWRAVIAVAAATVAVAGCGAGDGPAPAPPAGVSVSLAQWRSGEVSREIVVAVRNAGPDPVFFADLQLVSESFVTLPPRRVDTLLGRTPRTDLKIPYGEARCAPDRIPPVRPAVVVARLRVGTGPLRTVRFPIPHPDPLLRRLVAVDCGAFLLRRAARVEFGASWTERDGALQGTLVVTRVRDGVPIVIDRLDGTTNYRLSPAAPGPGGRVAVLAAGTDRVEVPVRVTPARCDAHAFADAKKAFEFAVAGSVGGGETYAMTVPLPMGLRRGFSAYALRSCGLPVPGHGDGAGAAGGVRASGPGARHADRPPPASRPAGGTARRRAAPALR